MLVSLRSHCIESVFLTSISHASSSLSEVSVSFSTYSSLFLDLWLSQPPQIRAAFHLLCFIAPHRDGSALSHAINRSSGVFCERERRPIAPWGAFGGMEFPPLFERIGFIGSWFVASWIRIDWQFHSTSERIGAFASPVCQIVSEHCRGVFGTGENRPLLFVFYSICSRSDRRKGGNQSRPDLSPANRFCSESLLLLW